MIVPASKSGGGHVTDKVEGFTESGVVEHSVGGSRCAEKRGENNGGIGGTVGPVSGSLGISSVGSVGRLKSIGEVVVDTVEKVSSP